MWINSTFETQQCDTSEFSRKNPWNLKNIFLIFFPPLTQGLNQLINLVQSPYIYILLQIFLAIIFVFDLPLRLRVVHIGKNYKISIFSKTASTKLIKFCRFTVHSKPNNVTLSAFPEIIPEPEKKFNYSVWPSPNGAPNPTDQSHPFSSPANISIPAFFFFIFDLLLN